MRNQQRNVRLIVFLYFLVGISSCLIAQSPPVTNSACEGRTKVLWSILKKKHISPYTFTPELGAEIIQLALEELDSRQIHFLESDVQLIKQQAIAAKPLQAADLCRIVSLISKQYQIRLKESQTILQIIGIADLRFDEEEVVQFSTYGRVFSSSYEKKANRWKRYVKFLVLNDAYNALDTTQLTQALPPKDFLLNKKKLTDIIAQKELKKLSVLLNEQVDYDTMVMEVLLNAICKRFDPHSEYYNYEQYKRFTEQLESQVLSFGVFFDETSMGNLSVSYIAPGSSVWFSNKIQQGDIVLALKLNQQSFDAVMLTADEANELLHSEKYTVLELTVKKSSGAVETIKLKKEAVKFEGSTVKSFVLKAERKIGYVSIPSFYSDADNPTALGCANELSKEILKLKNENIEGLIIDLRFNGGGSLYEAISMSGLFIDIGPLFYTADNTSKATLYKDMSRGTVYDGPLFIMVNGYSASASELFSLAMQDNHRALIIGEQTYGKATGQTFAALDTTANLDKLTATDKMGVVKYTQMKLYRSNGMSYQGKGIVPDIMLPYLETTTQTERDAQYCIVGDSITKKAVFPFPPVIPTVSLKEKNMYRMQHNAAYTLLSKVSDSLRITKNEDVIIRITDAGFWKDMHTLDNATDRISQVGTHVRPGFDVYYNQLENEYLSYDSNYKQLYNVYLEDLKKDLIIQNVYDLMSDFIQQSQK